MLHGILATMNEFYSANLATEVLKGMGQKGSSRAVGWPGAVKAVGVPGAASTGTSLRDLMDRMGHEPGRVPTRARVRRRPRGVVTWAFV
jgi:hypothetical protein